MLRRLAYCFSLALVIVGQCPAQQREADLIAQSLAAQLGTAQSHTVAITHFTNEDGYDAKFGNLLVKQLYMAIAPFQKGDHPIKLADRQTIDEIVKEQNLQYTKQFDRSTFQKIGKGTGADVVITGSFNVVTNKVLVFARATNMSMEVVASANAEIPRTHEIDEFLGSKVNVIAGSKPLPTGTWSGKLYCSLGEGTVTETIRSRPDGSVEVNELYSHKIPILKKPREGSFEYEGSWNPATQTFDLKTTAAMKLSYELSLALTPDGRELKGTYKHHPDCTGSNLRKDSSTP